MRHIISIKSVVQKLLNYNYRSMLILFKNCYTEIHSVLSRINISKPKIKYQLDANHVWLIVVNRRRRRENRPRRQRTTFSSDQTVKLEIEYSRTEYITRSRRYELAELLCLTENQIKIWFQNRRAKEKRIEKAHMDHHLRYW